MKEHKLLEGMQNDGVPVVDAVKLAGKVDTTLGVTVNFYDAAGNALHCSGTTVPTDAGAGYAKGCIFIDTNVATGSTGLYVNIGTTASCNFNAVDNAADA